MGEDDGVLGRGAVEIRARGVPALLEQRVVVAAPGHRLAGGNVVLVDPRPHLAHDVVDVVDVAHRRRVQQQRGLVAPRAQEVAVRVDEAGQEGAFSQVHHPGRGPLQRHHLVPRARRHDRFAAHRDRLHGGLPRIHGDDVVAEEDGVRRVGVRGGFRGASRDDEGEGQRESCEGFSGSSHDSLHAFRGDRLQPAVGTGYTTCSALHAPAPGQTETGGRTCRKER